MIQIYRTLPIKSDPDVFGFSRLKLKKMFASSEYNVLTFRLASNILFLLLIKLIHITNEREKGSHVFIFVTKRYALVFIGLFLFPFLTLI